MVTPDFGEAYFCTPLHREAVITNRERRETSENLSALLSRYWRISWLKDRALNRSACFTARHL